MKATYYPGRRIYINFLFALSILLLISISAAHADNIIVGGKRVGPVKLGDPLSKYEKVLGPRKTLSQTFFDYPKRGIALMVKNGKIEGIMVYSSAYKTKEGVKVGASINLLEKKFGAYLKTDTGALVYSDMGLAFNEKNYKITKIMVVQAKPDLLLGDRMIVAGQRLGNIMLGMDISQVQKHWGQPTGIEKIDSKFTIYKYNQKGIKLIVEGGIVAGAQILSYKYRTPEGISVKSTKEQVIKTYGKRFKEVKNSISYTTLGIGFYFTNNQVVEILLTPRTE